MQYYINLYPKILRCWLIIFWGLGCLSGSANARTNSTTEPSCSREKSRAVRQILNRVFYPLYEKHRDASMIGKPCRLSRLRDIYHHQETEGKIREHSARWICNYCGKRFISEEFLDQHFQRKHNDYLNMGVSRVCLADYCEMFRCENTAYSSSDIHWHQALCDQQHMDDLHASCQQLISECIPSTPWKAGAEGQDQDVRDLMMTRICSFLSCSRYWSDEPKPMSSWLIAFYIVLAICVVVGVSFYYIVVYMYMYSDEERSVIYPSKGQPPAGNIIYPPSRYHEQLRYRQDQYIQYRAEPTAS